MRQKAVLVRVNTEKEVHEKMIDILNRFNVEEAFSYIESKLKTCDSKEKKILESVKQKIRHLSEGIYS